MSIQHVGAVLHEMPELRSQGAAFALAVIADSADRRTGWTFDFTMAEAAKFARLTERAMRRLVRALESQGYIRTKLNGRAGRQRLRFRVLFDMAGKRWPEAELYRGDRMPPAKGTTGDRMSPPRDRMSPPGDTNDTRRSPGTVPANKDHAHAHAHIRLSPSLSVKNEQKLARPRTKKIPGPSETESQRRDRIESERRRQLAALGAHL